MLDEAVELIDLQIAVNGSPIRGLLHASIVTSNHFSSDSFALTFALGPFPLGDIIFWSSLSSAYIEVNAIEEYELSPQTLISGMIDSVLVDPIQGTVAVEGRDLSSSLIDSYNQQDFVNQTASDVVTSVALSHGLTPVVTSTSGSVGRYYGDGYTRLSLGQFSRIRSDWDLLVQLARENSFDVFVQGTALFFQPVASSSSTSVRIPLSDVSSVRLQRALTIASDTTARVQSWNSQHMTSYDSIDPTDGANSTSTSPTGSSQPFLFSSPNFTSQQVTDSAARYAAELTRLGVTLHIDMPWDLALAPRTIIVIDETGCSFDGIYSIEQIERHYSTTSGSTQTVRAVMNQS